MGCKLKIPRPLNLSYGNGQWFICLEEEFFELIINTSSSKNEFSGPVDKDLLRQSFETARIQAITKGLIGSGDFFSVQIRTSGRVLEFDESYLTWLLYLAFASLRYKSIPLERHYSLLEDLKLWQKSELARSSFLGGLSVLSQDWSIMGDLRIPFSPMLSMSRVKSFNLGLEKEDLVFKQACLHHGLMLNKMDVITKGLIPLSRFKAIESLHHSKNVLGLLPLKEDFDLIVFSDTNSLQEFMDTAPPSWQAETRTISSGGITKL